MPPPPGKFSTITGWPRIWVMRFAMMRPMTSVPPPAAHGITMVSGCVGQSSAKAGSKLQKAIEAAAMMKASMRTWTHPFVTAPSRLELRERQFREPPLE